MKRKIITKNCFLQNTFVITLLIVLSRVLRVIYVIPFYSIIKEQGGALYGYAYTIYSFFLAITTFGLPLAVRKIIKEYQAKGYYKNKDKTFKIAKKMALVISFLAFILLFLLAPLLSKLILGNLKGGNSLEQVTYVIRIVSIPLFIVPILNIYRAYLEGHNYLEEKFFSNVVEQIIKFTVIILGSFISIRLFHLSLKTTVGVALFGLVAGAIGAYFYVLDIIKKNKKNFNTDIKVKEPKITTKVILKKIISYALPFIMIDLFKVIYDFVDVLTVVKTISSMDAYSVKDAESIMGVLSLWGSNFTMIIVSISTTIVLNMIPKLTSAFAEKNMEQMNNKVNQILELLILFIVPITIGMSIISKPIWMIFYGPSKFGSSIFSYYIFIALFISIYLVVVSIIFVLKDYKTVFISLLIGFILKVLLNVSLMNSFNKMGLPPYYGSISATIIGYFVSTIICLYVLYKKHKINYESTLKEIINIFLATILMITSILLLRLVLPHYTNSRVLNIPLVICYIVVGAVVYFITVYKTKTINNIFEKVILKKDINKGK